MRVRFRPQASTKWWILLAAILAGVLTWLSPRDHRRPEPHPAPAPDAELIEIELAP